MTGFVDDGTDFFSWTLFHDISPAIRELYRRRQEELFAEGAENSYIETRSLRSVTHDNPLQLASFPSDRSVEDKRGIEDPPGYGPKSWKDWSSGCIKDQDALQKFAKVSLHPKKSRRLIKRSHRRLMTQSTRSCKYSA